MDGSMIGLALALALASVLLVTRLKMMGAATLLGKTNFPKFAYSLIFMFALSACSETEIELIEVPANTPPQAAIYIAGNFNEWNPGDERYRMTYRPSTQSYFVLIEPGSGVLEYKFTRGDWTSVEVDSCGNEIPNRSLDIQNSPFDRVRIENWSDLNPNFCDFITLCIEEVPPGTQDTVYVAGDFNKWDLSDTKVFFLPQGSGPWYVHVPKTPNGSFFKFHRGSWKTGEIDERGFPRKNRYSAPDEKDSIHVKIDGWWDQLAEEQNTLTFEIIAVPAFTPSDAQFYLSSSQFDWDEAREELQFELNEKGTYTLTIPRVNYRFSYKIHRGNWSTVESDAQGNDILNRSFLQGTEDTIQLVIDGWPDMAEISK